MLPVMTAPTATAATADTPAPLDWALAANRLAIKLMTEAPAAMVREHKLPRLPPGVRPVGGFAQDNQLGSLFSYLNGAGNGFCGLGFPGYPYLAELAQRSEYRAPVETIANELTREWVKLTGADENKLDELKKAMIEFGVREKFRLAAIHDGEFGRGQIYINLKGHNSPERRKKPLKIGPETITKDSLIGFQNIEPMWTTPYAYNTSDPTQPDFYRPDRWYVMGKETHADRLLTFIARPLPDMLKPSYNFGGLSLAQLIEPYVNRWLKVVDGVSRIITSYSITYIATNMQATLTDAGGATTLADRARIFNLMRDNRGLGFIDKGTEEFGQLNTPLSGLSELQAQAQEHMAAPTHIPLVFLTGITPSGLNASSEGEIKVFYNWIAGEQENFFSGHLRTVLQILQLHLWGAVDDKITFEWVPLDAPTDKESSEIRKADSESAATYITNSVISPDEARERLKADPQAGYTFLKGKAPELPDPAAEAELQHQLGQEGAELDHGRAEESAQADHARQKELERIKAKGKGVARDARLGSWFTRTLKRMLGQDTWNESDHPRAANGKFGSGGNRDPGHTEEPDDSVQSAPMYNEHNSAEYEAARATHGAASRKYTAALAEYRAGKIDDKTYLAARAEWKKADAEFDKAYEAEVARAEAEAAKPVVEPPSPQQSLL